LNLQYHNLTATNTFLKLSLAA